MVIHLDSLTKVFNLESLAMVQATLVLELSTMLLSYLSKLWYSSIFIVLPFGLLGGYNPFAPGASPMPGTPPTIVEGLPPPETPLQYVLQNYIKNQQANGTLPSFTNPFQALFGGNSVAAADAAAAVDGETAAAAGAADGISANPLTQILLFRQLADRTRSGSSRSSRGSFGGAGGYQGANNWMMNGWQQQYQPNTNSYPNYMVGGVPVSVTEEAVADSASDQFDMMLRV